MVAHISPHRKLSDLEDANYIVLLTQSSNRFQVSFDHLNVTLCLVQLLHLQKIKHLSSCIQEAQFAFNKLKHLWRQTRCAYRKRSSVHCNSKVGLAIGLKNIVVVDRRRVKTAVFAVLVEHGSRIH